jgi:hypothetical protein
VYWGKIMKLIICFLIILLFNFCGRGPAEDRAETNCRNYYLTSLLAIDAINNPPDNLSQERKESREEGLKAYFFLYDSQCLKPDSLLNRYYRGYVLGKE